MSSNNLYEKLKEAQRVLEEIRDVFEATTKERDRVKQESDNAAMREISKANLCRMEVQAENDKLQHERNELRRDNGRLRQEIAKIMAHTAKALTEKNKILAEKDKMQQEIENLQAEKNNILAQKSRAEQEKYRVLAENSKMQAEAYEKELQRAKKENEHLILMESQRMQTVDLRLAERARKAEGKNMANLAKKIEEEANDSVGRANYSKEEAERNLERGIPAMKYPTGPEIQETIDKLQYQEGNVHLAIAGISGSGKSSLVNALRGYSNSDSDDPNIAKTGTTETTESIGRYFDPYRPWLVWYDVPGAGTLKVPAWQYFNNQGLYIFNTLIIVTDNRFTQTDVNLLFSCKRFGIPTFVVRSKADQHIRNFMNDEDDDDSNDSDEERFIRARDKFVTDTRQDFKALLDSAGLPPQDIYIVSKKTLMGVVKGDERVWGQIIDELRFVSDVLTVVDEKRKQELS